MRNSLGIRVSLLMTLVSGSSAWAVGPYRPPCDNEGEAKDSALLVLSACFEEAGKTAALKSPSNGNGVCQTEIHDYLAKARLYWLCEKKAGREIPAPSPSGK